MCDMTDESQHKLGADLGAGCRCDVINVDLSDPVAFAQFKMLIIITAAALSLAFT